MSPIGTAARELFALRPGLVQLNHGSFGATPRAILWAQRVLRDAMEADPIQFMVEADELGGVRAAAGQVAPRFGTRGEHLAFVENATAGVCTVLRSLSLGVGDRIVTTTHAYGAVARALEVLAARTGATIDAVPLPFPLYDPGDVLEAVLPALDGASLLVVDWITSKTALVLPVDALVAACRARGVPVLVDAAHVPGHLPMDLDALGADWVTGNLHKWAFAPKGTAVLYARDRSTLVPLQWSHDVHEGFPDAFDWVGTRDVTSWLVAPDAVAFGDRWPGLMDDRAALCRQMAEALSARWGTRTTAPASCQGCMATLALPERVAAMDAVELRLRARAVDMEVAAIPFAGRTWLRISAAVYNHPAEYMRLGEFVAGL
jgi:isopenicillin-N epimerase